MDEKVKSLKKAQVGAIIFAILAVALLAVPFALDPMTMAFQTLMVDGAFDFNALINSSLLGGEAFTELYAIAGIPALFIAGKLSLDPSMLAYINDAFYYMYILFWVSAVILLLFTIIGFCGKVGRFFNKFFAFFTWIFNILLIIISLAYVVAAVWMIIETGFSVDILLSSGAVVALLIFVFSCCQCGNSIKILARKPE